MGKRHLSRWERIKQSREFQCVGRFFGKTLGGDLNLGSISDGDTKHEQVNWNCICGECLRGLRSFLEAGYRVFSKG